MGTNYGPEIKYKCQNDCTQSGCPGHSIAFNENRTSDTYSVAVDGKSEFYFDPEQFRALLEAYEAHKKFHEWAVEPNQKSGSMKGL